MYFPPWHAYRRDETSTKGRSATPDHDATTTRPSYSRASDDLLGASRPACRLSRGGQAKDPPSLDRHAGRVARAKRTAHGRRGARSAHEALARRGPPAARAPARARSTLTWGASRGIGPFVLSARPPSFPRKARPQGRVVLLCGLHEALPRGPLSAEGRNEGAVLAPEDEHFGVRFVQVVGRGEPRISRPACLPFAQGETFPSRTRVARTKAR